MLNVTGKTDDQWVPWEGRLGSPVAKLPSVRVRFAYLAAFVPKSVPSRSFHEVHTKRGERQRVIIQPPKHQKKSVRAAVRAQCDFVCAGHGFVGHVVDVQTGRCLSRAVEPGWACFRSLYDVNVCCFLNKMSQSRRERCEVLCFFSSRHPAFCCALFEKDSMFK